MHPMILLYNFVQDERTRQIRGYLSKAGITARLVSAPDYQKPLGYLFGLPGFSEPSPVNLGANFKDEMLVMHNFSNNQLDQLLAFFRERQLSPVALKAVLTPVNCHWNSLKLHEELLKERDAMRR